MFLPVLDLYLLPDRERVSARERESERARERESERARERERERERAASNLQKPAALQHYLLAASMKCTTDRLMDITLTA